MIRTGAGLHLWEDEKDLAKRKVVYTQIGEQLERPQPPRKIIKKLTPIEVTPFKRGQLLKYRCWDGEYLLLWVRGEYRYKGDVLPLCAAFDWKGPTLPSRREILALRPVLSSTDMFIKESELRYAARTGEQLPPEPVGEDWSGYAPCEASQYGFDMSRVEIVPGDWGWELLENGRGPQIPRWIELGPTVARDLSATVAYRKTLSRHEFSPCSVLPEKRRALAPCSAPPRVLGVDVPLPAGRVSRTSRLLTLKRTKHQPVPGDIFVVNVKGCRWVVGRVILADGHFACGPADVLVYFYRQSFRSTGEITLPMKLDDLAIPPCCAHDSNWQWGEFFHIAHVPVEPCELPFRHIFGPNTSGYYHDAYGLPTSPPAESEVVGSVGIGGIDSGLAKAFGIE